MGTRPQAAVSEHLDRPYEISVVRRGGDEGMAWSAQVEELAGCEVRAATEAEALSAVREAMAEWIADALSNDRPVPPPRAEADHSGRLLVRMPRTLHAELARLADRERVSLNALIVGILGGATAWRQPGASGRAPEVAATRPAEAPHAQAPAPDTPPPSRAGLVDLALRVNVIVVAVAAAVAVALLIAALAA